MCVISISLIHTSYAQTQSYLGTQVTLSESLLNDPIAQDLLKKIEQTRKMIEELKQKEFEKNQAQENLEKMRDISVKHLNQNLDEWERIWEKHSSRNSFERFVNTKPSFVQGVFWDQFEFTEQKIIAGRIAMNQVLTSGGIMQDAINAYNKAAASKRIELIEINSQSNVKHNLANYEEQQIFNSTGQIHASTVTQMKLAKLYSDYKLQPTYILANSDDRSISKLNSVVDSNTECVDGYVLVSRVITERYTCIDESIAKKWIINGVPGIVIIDSEISGFSSIFNVKTNPGTKCKDGYQVIYHIEASEYQCVLESVAKEMLDHNTAEAHTLTEYILNKDKQKTDEDIIYEINQEIFKINEEYDIKKKTLEFKYDDKLENENSIAKQKMQEIIKEYKTKTHITKEDVTKHISEVRTANDSNKEILLNEKSDAVNKLELEIKNEILGMVKGYENNLNINVDWDYLNETSFASTEMEESKVNTVKVSLFSENNLDEIHLHNIGVINSFGQKFDEIKSNQVLQIAADITNSNDYKQDFAYMVEITNEKNVLVQPAKWMTGTLNPHQTFNVGLSWTPEETGDFKAILSIGTEIDSVLQVADMKINVNPEINVSDGNYCKKEYELLFKYIDNSPICATSDTALKLINIGYAFV